MRSTSSARAVRKSTGTSENRRRLRQTLESAHVGQTHVENHQIMCPGIQDRQGFATQGAAVGGEAVGPEGVGEGVGYGGFVVDDENFHGAMVFDSAFPAAAIRLE